MPPRVAFFPDSFHEVNGVAHTSRHFLAFATRHHLPFLCIRAAAPALRTPSHQTTGPIQTLDLPRSRAAIGLERDLSFDPLFARHAAIVERTLKAFRPDIIHITGPSELGISGAYYAWKHKIPLAASWHTNVHEYAAQRLSWLTRHIGGAAAIERTTLAITTRFYSLAKTLFAPNPDLCRMLEAATHHPCHLMQRGVDTTLFAPTHRTRTGPNPFTLGFVGRLSVEKNVALLPRIAHQLRTLTTRPVQFVLIGHGAEESALRRAFQDLPDNTPKALFPGVLRGPALAEAYANMDLFLFPSHTDTFGNVVLEALASGVPAIVTPDGGPAYIVQQAQTGHIVPDEHFAPTIAALLASPAPLATMRHNARTYAETCSWDAVFNRVYAAYPTQP